MSVPSYQPDRVLIAANPIAGARCAAAEVQQLRELLSQQGLAVEVEGQLARIEQLAHDWHAQNSLRAVVAVGGDGTAAAVLNCLPSGAPLTLLARGTENLLARHFGLGRAPEDVAETILEGETVTLDAGLANGRLFTLMASCGFDAEVVARLHAARTGHIRRWTYVRPAWNAVRQYEYPLLTAHLLLADGTEHTHTCRWFFGFNLPCYALDLPIAARADGSDGLLDVCTFQRGSCWHVMRYLAAVAACRHESLADCYTARVQRARIESDRPVAYQVDGDPGGFLPLEIEVLRGRMTLLRPRAVQARQLESSLGTASIAR